MDFDLSQYEDSDVLLSDDNLQTSASFPYDLKDLSSSVLRSEYISDDGITKLGNESSDNVESSDNYQSSDADDLLRNGILVETNKGLVCMSLKDVLSSNLNLSVEDFQKVAAQLLSQQEVNKTPLPSTSKTNNYQEVKVKDDNKTSESTSVSKADQSVTSENTVSEKSTQKVSFIPIATKLFRPTSINSGNKPLSKETVKETTFLINNLQNDDSKNIFKLLPSTVQKVDTSENEREKEETNDIPNIAIKRRGGWPKGRKRKPELVNLPPKAPKTSYNIFLNERRKLYKDQLAFHEITRVVGNQWSNLSAEEKRPYMLRAEEDKKRYREELRIYRQSDAYKMYLASKRKKRAMDNLMSESDMDGTDDIDDEDNDTLYCDMCDQWFYNLHNKREHLLSRQHKMLVAGDMTRELASSDSEYKAQSSIFSTSLDESSMDATPIETDCSTSSKSRSLDTKCVYDNIVQLIDSVSNREKEIKVLDARLKESISKQNSLLLELNSLNEKAAEMRITLSELKEQENVLEQQFSGLWNVPSLFVMNSEFVNNL